MHCGQTVGRMKTKLGTQVGLGPCHIVLDGDPAPLPQRGTAPPIFGPYLLRPNGCMDQDVTYFGMEQGLGQGDFVLDGDHVPPPQKGAEHPPPIFGPCLLRPNGWMNEAGTCPSTRAHWRHLTNTIELVHPSAHSTPQSKRRMYRFSRFCTAYGRKCLYFNYNGCPYPPELPVRMEDLDLPCNT